ncbi:phosphatidylinositol-specific phospholipase C/glycerophosphodiester phosphodiesterase family protein [Streptomyces sp. H27-C3]|uniref:phosphatidylinositol-specific phospholipase C/glycerophosphodiester phosphodiesterase family protein n=1 Tax=Streptomyces sp. H27-C3 TaxID=3046305 RepID=UPI0024B9E2EF|nr:phosphatidylinositol-specific phospholipase C/glycerophosphodiester phosphodiesterase family protein [Streptomyces sp. H27-C3]MDJ0462475.1 phosphatidylinositol-specific phospholipase C/glycerophosphodiester phosphodiesterase family protein [Streptomyces sp. H27-C3]
MADPAPTRRRAVTTLAAALAGVAAVPMYAQAAERAPTAGKHPPKRPRHPRPLSHAHAHNDYEHRRPLLDALSHGFTSVEADIYLVDGQLLVAHDPVDLDPTRTLESLYLAPLMARVRANHGTVHPGYRRPVQLLVDIKTEGAATYLELHRHLRRYQWMLSTCAQGRVRLGAVTAVVSGDRAARVPMEAQRVRYASYDGRLEDLGTDAPASFIPLISSNWTQSFSWLGVGAFPVAERTRLHAVVSAAHARRQRVRFWATPDLPGSAREAVWTELLAAAVDHINTDDLAGLERFLRTHRA